MLSRLTEQAFGLAPTPLGVAVAETVAGWQRRLGMDGADGAGTRREPAA